MQNTKPSAIFRIRDPKRDQVPPGMMRTATLGISIETLDEVERQMQSLSSSSQSTPSNALALAAKSQPNTLMQQAAQLAAPIGTCKEVTLIHSLPNTHTHTHTHTHTQCLSLSHLQRKMCFRIFRPSRQTQLHRLCRSYNVGLSSLSASCSPRASISYCVIRCQMCVQNHGI